MALSVSQLPGNWLAARMADLTPDLQEYLYLHVNQKSDDDDDDVCQPW